LATKGGNKEVVNFLGGRAGALLVAACRLAVLRSGVRGLVSFRRQASAATLHIGYPTGRLPLRPLPQDNPSNYKLTDNPLSTYIHNP